MGHRSRAGAAQPARLTAAGSPFACVRSNWRTRWGLLCLACLILPSARVQAGPVPPGPGWSAVQEVDSNLAGFGRPALAIRGPARAHLSYVDREGTRHLRYATNVLGDWLAEDVDTADIADTHNAIAIDSGGNAHIAYSTTIPSLRYATNATGNWTSEPLPNEPTHYPVAIAVDTTDKVHVLYITDMTGDLRHAVREANGWTVATVLTEKPLGRPALVAGQSGRIHACYLTTAGLRYATYDPAASPAWTAVTAVEGLYDAGQNYNGFAPALTLDGDGHAHAAYVDPLLNQLYYVTNGSGDWTAAEPVAAAGVEGFAAAIFVSDADVSVFYYDPAAQTVKQATRGDPWQVTEPAPALTGLGTNAAVACDAEGSAYLAWAQGTAVNYASDTPATARGWDVSVTITSNPARVENGDSITYTIDIANAGAEAAPNVTVSATVTGGTIASVQGSSGVEVTRSGQTVTGTIAELASGETKTITIVVQTPNVAGTVSVVADANAADDIRSGNNAASVATQVDLRTYDFIPTTVNGGNGQVQFVDSPPYVDGQLVEVKALPDPGFQLKYWKGTIDDTSKLPTNQVRVGRTASVEVAFEPVPIVQYRLTCVVTNGKGTVLPLGGLYDEGTRVQLSASAKKGYRLKRWSGTDHDDWKGDTNEVTMTANRVVTVDFEALPQEPPVADWRWEGEMTSGTTVTLDGTYSYDPNDDELTYHWEYLGDDPPIVINDADQAIASFVVPPIDEETHIAIQLTVSDGQAEDVQEFVIRIYPGDGKGGDDDGPGPCPGATPASNIVLFHSLAVVWLFGMKWGIRRRRG